MAFATQEYLKVSLKSIHWFQSSCGRGCLPSHII